MQQRLIKFNARSRDQAIDPDRGIGNHCSMIFAAPLAFGS
jgi:hypothetical protein